RFPGPEPDRPGSLAVEPLVDDGVVQTVVLVDDPGGPFLAVEHGESLKLFQGGPLPRPADAEVEAAGAFALLLLLLGAPEPLHHLLQVAGGLLSTFHVR